MKALSDADLVRLAERLGHGFENQRHLIEAMTHPSAHAGARSRQKNYQRLEFLGDRVLALVVAEMLIEAFPTDSEGALSRRLTQLVRAETCAEVARELDLGAFMILGDGEAATGGRGKLAILSDVAEAVIGAIYRDGGFDAARAFVERYWRPRMTTSSDEELRDAKTTLQEWAQARGHGTPIYRLVDRKGPDHSPQFVMAVDVPGIAESAKGTGPSKRLGEQAAAEAMLARHANQEGKGA